MKSCDRIDGVAEHDDVAALRIADRQDLALDDRQPDPVGVLVDQDVVADDQRGTHRRRGDPERLGDERAQQEHDEQDRKEALRVLDPPRLGLAGGTALREVHAVGEPDDAGRDGEEKQDQREVHRAGTPAMARARRFGRGPDCPMRARTGPAVRRGTSAIRRAGARRARPAPVVGTAIITSRPPAGWRGTLPAGSRRCPPTSCASCPPSASRAACACG